MQAKEWLAGKMDSLIDEKEKQRRAFLRVCRLRSYLDAPGFNLTGIGAGAPFTSGPNSTQFRARPSATMRPKIAEPEGFRCVRSGPLFTASG